MALDELGARLAQTDRTALEEMLSAVDAKLGRVLDMAAELPDLAVIKAKLRELRGEREKVAGELARTARALPTLEELEPLERARLRDLRATLEADVGLGRLALGAVLGEDRLRVYADGRIEGTATLRPETRWAPRRTLGAHRLSGSGGSLRATTGAVRVTATRRVAPRCLKARGTLGRTPRPTPKCHDDVRSGYFRQESTRGGRIPLADGGAALGPAA